MRKYVILFFPLLLFVLIPFLKLGFSIKIPYLDPFWIPVQLSKNFATYSDFRVNNSRTLWLLISVGSIILYGYIYARLVKISLLLVKEYFSWNTNKNLLLRRKLQHILQKNALLSVNWYEIYEFYKFWWKYLGNKERNFSNEEMELNYLTRDTNKKFIQLNAIFKRHIWEENYVKDIEIQENEYITFLINKAKLTNDEVVKKFMWIENEIQKLFSSKNMDAWILIDSKNFNTIKITIFNKNVLWPDRKMDFKNMKLKKWDLRLWFFQKIDKWVKNYDYVLPSKDLNHLVVSASSRSWKDVTIGNLIISILYNIKSYKNMELHFFDTKWVDGAYLDNLKNNWIYRYKNIVDYPEILVNLVKDMRENSKIIEDDANIYNYNARNPKNAIKEKFIIINEFLSLNNSLSARELNTVLQSIISLTSEGAWFGYKVIIMSQTMRKDSSTAFASILANIKTRLILKSFQNDEVRINARGLNDEDISRVTNMKKYNCFYIEDNEILQEFKAYLTKNEDIKKWIDENFSYENSTELSEKILDYYRFAKEQNKISHKEATKNFWLTQKEWEIFIGHIEWKNEIERLPNNTIIWKK